MISPTIFLGIILELWITLYIYYSMNIGDGNEL
jgi:hypothetical protein